MLQEARFIFCVCWLVYACGMRKPCLSSWPGAGAPAPGQLMSRAFWCMCALSCFFGASSMLLVQHIFGTVGLSRLLVHVRHETLLLHWAGSKASAHSMTHVAVACAKHLRATPMPAVFVCFEDACCVFSSAPHLGLGTTSDAT
jgi:hypothetical protein